jgi:hypothetical protein
MHADVEVRVGMTKAAVPPAKPTGMRRVAIVEEDDEDEDEAPGHTAQATPPPPTQAQSPVPAPPVKKTEAPKGRTGKRVVIEEDEEEEELVAPAAVSAAPVTTSAAKVPDQAPLAAGGKDDKAGKEKEKETFRRVPIIEDEDEDGRASPEPALTGKRGPRTSLVVNWK